MCYLQQQTIAEKNAFACVLMPCSRKIFLNKAFFFSIACYSGTQEFWSFYIPWNKKKMFNDIDSYLPEHRKWQIL